MSVCNVFRMSLRTLFTTALTARFVAGVSGVPRDTVARCCCAGVSALLPDMLAVHNQGGSGNPFVPNRPPLAATSLQLWIIFF